MQLIEEQADRAKAGRPSRIFAKTNALVDHRIIESLYRASQAGVPIDLVDRGICCLRPGLPGISETIRVRSIVDRFLEHSRIYVFGADDDECKIYLASADWMPRNFYRRVEVMFPIEAPDLRERVLHEIIPAYLRDNVKSRVAAARRHIRPAESGRWSKALPLPRRTLGATSGRSGSGTALGGQWFAPAGRTARCELSTPSRARTRTS